MFKKLIAGIVVASLLSTGSMALANAPQKDRKNVSYSRAVLTEQKVKPKHHERVTVKSPGPERPGQSRVEITTWAEEAQPRPKAPKKGDVVERLQQKAEALGIDISGLSFEEIRNKIKEALKEQKAERKLERWRQKAQELGIEVSDLSIDEIKAKIKEAMREQRAKNQLEILQKKAEALGIDITGLSVEEIRSKMKEARKEQAEQFSGYRSARAL